MNIFTLSDIGSVEGHVTSSSLTAVYCKPNGKKKKKEEISI